MVQDQGAAGNVKNNIFEKKSWAVFDGTQMKPPPAPQSGKLKVAKLLDSYLAEVARDSKLPLRKFQALAEVLPEYSRLSDDGLYRAIDTYLKVSQISWGSLSYCIENGQSNFYNRAVLQQEFFPAMVLTLTRKSDQINHISGYMS